MLYRISLATRKRKRRDGNAWQPRMTRAMPSPPRTRQEQRVAHHQASGGKSPRDVDAQRHLALARWASARLAATAAVTVTVTAAAGGAARDTRPLAHEERVPAWRKIVEVP